MKNVEFCKIMKDLALNIDIKISNEQCNELYQYMNELLKWNEKFNLTAITDEKEIIMKHFIDSLTINKYLKDAKNIIDVGTGAGFPGIPIAIMNRNINITLLDSLNKRVNFLNNIIKELNLSNVKAIHGRAEDIAKIKDHRERYDIVISRAVAPLNILLEYMLPFNIVNGSSICMKGSNIEEIESSYNALDQLGGEIENIDKIFLPNSEIERNVIIVKKVKKSPNKYPRKAGMPKKDPL